MGCLGLTLFIAAPLSTVSAEGAGATSPNPTTGSAFNVSVQIWAWSDGLTIDWYANPQPLPSEQDVSWEDLATSQTGQLSTNCSGNDFSVFIPLPPGEYVGGASLKNAIYVGGVTPSTQYDLVVGGSTPHPPTACTPPPPRSGNVDQPIVGMASTASENGYWLVGSDGSVEAVGDATYYGDLPSKGIHPAMPIVGIAPSYSSGGLVNGYWEVAADGGIFAFGSAPFYGSMGGRPLNRPMVGLAVAPGDQGYWTVASDGGIFSFGPQARFYGSAGSMVLNEPVVGMTADYGTGGYWLVASDGGIFAYHAPFYGSTGAIPLNRPIEEMAAAPDGSGYRFVASDGGVFCFNLPFEGSLGSRPPANAISGMAASGPNGYWLVERDGTVHAFGTAPTLG